MASGVALAAFAAVAALAACDSGPAVKPSSVFLDTTDPNAWQLVGHVRAGTEPVVGALVRVDPSPSFPVDDRLVAAAVTDPRFSRTTTTDAAGLYRFQFDPFVYDLTISHDRDIYVFHDLMARAFDPPFAFEAPVAGFTSRVLPSTAPPAKSGNATVYFVSGDEARTLAAVSGTPGAFDAKFRHFESTITLHAIEYVAARGPAEAVFEGKVDVRVREGVVVTPVIAMTAITTVGAPTFSATPPPGYTLGSVELEMDLGLRTDAVPLPLTHIELDKVFMFPVATDARYFVRLRATKDGAVSDSGRYRVNPFDKNSLVLPPPVSSEAPVDDAAVPTGQGRGGSAAGTLAPGELLSARIEEGIVEHALVPESGAGTTFHVVTWERSAKLPDAGALGLPPAAGRYVWTLQSFPTLTFTDRLTGDDGRVVPPSWTSAPRVLVLH